jgi:hypothetical protein
MFVCSVKTSRRQLLALLGCVVLLIVLLAVAVALPAGSQAKATATVADTDERRAYLTALGYELDLQYEEVREVLIPDEFDEVFTQYNQLQQAAEMDFSPYHGKRVKCWTYRVTNHPEGGEVLAHLYVYKDKIVGGDVSSTSLGGFMTALVPLT